METIDAKRKAVLERIESCRRAIRKAGEYLESGKHANWVGFRPFFGRKAELPPHRDWVRNVFLPRQEKYLARDEKILEGLEHEERVRVRDNPALQRASRAKRSL